MDGIEEFKGAMRAHGLNPPEIIEPGKLHRFATNGKRHDDAGWCKLFADGGAGSSVTSGRGCLTPGKHSARSPLLRQNVKPFGNVARPNAGHGRPRRLTAMPKLARKRRPSWKARRAIRRRILTP